MYAENEILFIEQKIKAHERERIIKLLDELAFQINSVEHNPEEAEGAYRALALIKGENK
jgi:hypothetical protein